MNAAGDSGDAEQRRASTRRDEQAGWVRQIALGGRLRDAALKHLFDAYDAGVISRCMWRHGLARSDAEEVWQDVVVQICRRAADFRPDGDPAAWIMNMVDSRAIDLLRKPARHYEQPYDPAAPEVEALPAPQGAATHFAADECVQRGLQQFAREHPEEARFIALRDLDGLEVAELARQLGRTEEATRTYLKTLRKKLKPFLAPCLDLLDS